MVDNLGIHPVHVIVLLIGDMFRFYSVQGYLADEQNIESMLVLNDFIEAKTVVDAITITCLNKRVHAISVPKESPICRPGRQCRGKDGMICFDKSYMKINEQKSAILKVFPDIPMIKVGRFTRSISDIRGHEPDVERFIVKKIILADVLPLPARAILINRNLVLIVRTCGIRHIPCSDRFIMDFLGKAYSIF